MATQQRVYLLKVVISFWLTTVSLSQIIPQPDDILSGAYDNLNHNVSHLCTRTCTRFTEPKVCYYEFTLEPYTVLGAACKNCPETKGDCTSEQCVTADGIEKSILTINRRLPGPSIQVCTGDTIVVDIVNKMKGRSVTIHWHGIHQKQTPFMDGVPMVTQCPILEGQIFRYKFLAERPGTYFYHSHSGLQKLDGISGSLIIREPKRKDPNRFLYDFDLPSHVMVVQDWLHITADERQPSTKKNPGQRPDSYLINGKGVFSKNVWEALTFQTPITEFIVQEGKRYRFRIIGNTCASCNVEVSIESHPLMVIAADERDLEPIVFDKLVISSGERYDVVIKAINEPRVYWIIVQGVGACGAGKFQVAALKYIPKSTNLSVAAVHPLFPLTAINPKANVLNSPAINCSSVEPKGRCINKMQSSVKTPTSILKVKPDLRLTFTFRTFDYEPSKLFTTKPYLPYFMVTNGAHLLGLVNEVSLMNSPSPLLTQSSDIPKNLFCTKQCHNNSEPCECINIVKVPLNSVVEIVIADVDFTPVSHPFHLHGHSFHLITQGVWGRDFNTTLQELYSKLDSGVLLHDRLPVKDTVQVPASGYVVFRVFFDNPGYWYLHCHYLYHVENGMAAIIQVGEEADFTPIPARFPTCGNYVPAI